MGYKGPAEWNSGLGHFYLLGIPPLSSEAPFWLFPDEMLDKLQPQSALTTQPVGGGHSAQATLNWVWVHVMVIGCFCRHSLEPCCRGSALIEVAHRGPFQSWPEPLWLIRYPWPLCPLLPSNHSYLHLNGSGKYQICKQPDWGG